MGFLLSLIMEIDIEIKEYKIIRREICLLDTAWLLKCPSTIFCLQYLLFEIPCYFQLFPFDNFEGCGFAEEIPFEVVPEQKYEALKVILPEVLN